MASLTTFFALGGRLVDTAQMYKNYAEIGRALTQAGPMVREGVWLWLQEDPTDDMLRGCVAAGDTDAQACLGHRLAAVEGVHMCVPSVPALKPLAWLRVMHTAFVHLWVHLLCPGRAARS